MRYACTVSTILNEKENLLSVGKVRRQRVNLGTKIERQDCPTYLHKSQAQAAGVRLYVVRARKND